MLGSSCSRLLLGRGGRIPQKSQGFSQHCTPPDQTPGHTKRIINTNGARYLTDAVQRSVQATFCRVPGQTSTSLLAVPQSQRASCSETPAPIKDPRRCKLGNGASGCSEDSSPQEGASSPPPSEADPHHSWSPSTASVSSHTPPTIQAAEGLHIFG